MEEKNDFNGAHLGEQIYRASCVGFFSITAMTPMMNYNNYRLFAQKTYPFQLHRAFDGLFVYNLAVVPTLTLSMTANTLLNDRYGYSPTLQIKLINATLSGIIAGIFVSTPEAVAQAQQLSTPKPKASKVIQEVIRYNGIYALGRGMTASMIRQGISTAGLITGFPFLNKELQKRGYYPLVADAISAVSCGLLIGPLTAPWNKIRFEKQKNFHLLGCAPSYWEIIKNSGFKELMAGWKMRSVLSSCSMFLTQQGGALYDSYRPRVRF